MGDPLGSGDISTYVVNDDGVPDLDRSFRPISPRRSIIEGVARMWTTPRGSLITNLSRGVDTRNWLSSELDTSPDGLADLVHDLTAEALRSERVRAISVSIEVDETAETMTISGSIDPADESGPFDYVDEIDKLTAKILLPAVS